MPEGDSLRRAQARVAPVLEGRVREEACFRSLRGHRPRPGQRVERVEAVGKHLLVHLDRALTIHVHLGMSGRIRVGPPDQPLRTGATLRMFLRTEAGTVACHAAPTITTYVRDGSPSPVDHLGPDLSDDDVDLAEVVRRASTTEPGTLLADLLLDQRVAAGVGNVFKSEALFLAGLHPFTRRDALTDEQVEELWRIAHRLLVRNRSTPARTTTGDPRRDRTFVYGRHRLGCRRCDGPVRFSPAGEVTPRSTYWCPVCQPGPAEREA